MGNAMNDEQETGEIANSTIHIALTFDTSFWAPAYATMRSVCITSERKSDLVFHLLHLPLEDWQRDDLNSIKSEFGATLIYHDIDRTDMLGDRIKDLPEVTARRLHNIVYARLFVQDLLPSDAQRAIYLDCDLMVRSPIEHLYSIDMQGKTLAAVQQPDRIRALSGRDLREKKPLSPSQPYYNAGMLLIDLKRFRNVDIVAELKNKLTAQEISKLYFDQDIINVVFGGDILELSYLWNLQNPETAHEAFNPHILHYSGSKKPWALRPDVAFAATYRNMMTNELFYRYWRFRVARQIRGFFGLRA